MARIVHTAQALVDVLLEVPALPRSGQNVNASSAHRYAGGAVTILLAAARLGASAVHAGAIGSGVNGELIRRVLRAENVAVSAAPIADADSGECLVLIEPDGQRTFVTTYGAERHITATSLSSAEAEAGDFVCISGYSLFEPTCAPLLDYLETLDAGVQVVLDPGAPFADFPRELQDAALAHVTVWTSNLEEATTFTGIQDPAAAAKQLAERIDTVIVRAGERGCWVASGGDVSACAGYPQTAIDTNGAGDTHTGALLALRAAGASWVEAASAANAAAAIKVTRRGPDTAPTASEVAAFLRRHDPNALTDQLARLLTRRS